MPVFPFRDPRDPWFPEPSQYGGAALFVINTQPQRAKAKPPLGFQQAWQRPASVRKPKRTKKKDPA